MSSLLALPSGHDNMELYSSFSYRQSKLLTEAYSTSFSSSTRLFSANIRPHIYAIYGLVRIADEIVDTYQGADASSMLEQLRDETLSAIKRGYSANPLVHAFALTAARFDIGNDLIDPFFDSMAMDLIETTYTPELYERYIYGSAEVVGLMCLRVFVENNPEAYDNLAPGASALGAAYQKVNFLRDMTSDYTDRGRMYFPGVSYEDFDDKAKNSVIENIRQDFQLASAYINKLPASCRSAVATSYAYYSELLSLLEDAQVETIKSRRLRVSNWKKARLLLLARRKGEK